MQQQSPAETSSVCVSRLCSAGALQTGDVPALPSTAKRGLSLMGEHKWYDAMSVFSALQQKPADNTTITSSSDASIIQWLVTICRVQLGLTISAPQPDQASASFEIPMPQGKLTIPAVSPASAAVEGADSYAEVRPAKHPLQHLAAALTYSAQAAVTSSVSSKPGRGINAVGLRAQQRASARAAGEALAFLLHPAVYATITDSSSSGGSSKLPDALSHLALQLLSEQGKAAFSTAVGAGGTATAAAAGSWEQRAEGSKSKALQELVKLTGLDPVKREMFNLADQVRCCSARSCYVNMLLMST